MKKLICMVIAVAIVLTCAVTAFADFENTHKNTGNAANDLVSIAETQIGYSGKKYGAAESPAFISWCARQANISEESLPNVQKADKLYDFYAGTMAIHDAATYAPEKGDLIFLGENDTVTQCGIVTDANEEYITAVIYDTDNTVKKKMYTNGIDKILYYASPDYDIIPNNTTGRHMTIASALNFRTLPSTTGSTVITTIPFGTIVEITEISADGKWGKITYIGMEGWINLDYVKPYNDNYTDSSDYAVQWNVIDISKFQGSVNWDRVAANGIDGVILRIGGRYTRSKEIYTDDNFMKNYNGAKKAGLHVGCYFYSGAETMTQAYGETQFVIDMIRDNDLQFDMPVFIDIEDTVIERHGKSFITAVAKQFLDTMEEENIYSGVYSNTYWLTTYYDPTIFENHALWVADWRDQCYYTGPYGMWQYTEKGSIAGVESEYTDLSFCYINYPKLITDLGYNNTLPQVEKYKKGDPNGDGKITAADARLALRISAKLVTPTKEVWDAADVDENGNVTAADARKILRVSAKLDTIN